MAFQKNTTFQTQHQSQHHLHAHDYPRVDQNKGFHVLASTRINNNHPPNRACKNEQRDEQYCNNLSTALQHFLTPTQDSTLLSTSSLVPLPPSPHMSTNRFDGYLFECSRNPVAIIDIGSGLIKSGLEGFGTDKTGYTGPQLGKITPAGTPSHVLHNAVTPSKSRTSRATSCVCCDLALTHAHAVGESWDHSVAPVQIDQPVTRGKIRDFGQLENVLYHVLHHELECYVPDTPLMLTGKFLSTLNEVNIAPLAEIAFESFGHPTLAFVPPAPLILMGTGRLDGAVLDIGHGAAMTAAVLEGRTVPGSVCRVPIGGIDVTRELHTSLMETLSGLDGQSKTKAGDKIATTWAWRKAQVWEELKNKFVAFAPERGHSGALWSLR